MTGIIDIDTVTTYEQWHKLSFVFLRDLWVRYNHAYNHAIMACYKYVLTLSYV